MEWTWFQDLPNLLLGNRRGEPQWNWSLKGGCFLKFRTGCCSNCPQSCSLLDIINVKPMPLSMVFYFSYFIFDLFSFKLIDINISGQFSFPVSRLGQVRLDLFHPLCLRWSGKNYWSLFLYIFIHSSNVSINHSQFFLFGLDVVFNLD